VAFFWFPIRLATWLFGGITGGVMVLLSRRWRRMKHIWRRVTTLSSVLGWLCFPSHLWRVAAGLLPKEADRNREGLIGAARQVTITSDGTMTVRRDDQDRALPETMNRLAPGEGDHPRRHRWIQAIAEAFSDQTAFCIIVEHSGIGAPPGDLKLEATERVIDHF